MAFHIPFNQRNPAPRPAPIYIGFEVQRPPRKKFNWWGFNGMWMSFMSLFTAGFASPVPLLISLVGLRRPGKKMAAVGTFVSALGVALATTIVVGSVAAHHHQAEKRQIARYNRTVNKQIAETNALMAIAAIEIEEFREDVVDDQRFDIEANMLIIKHVDPWGESLRFELSSDDGIIRSAGPDGKFNTRDDISLSLEQSDNRNSSADKQVQAEEDFADDSF